MIYIYMYMYIYIYYYDIYIYIIMIIYIYVYTYYDIYIYVHIICIILGAKQPCFSINKLWLRSEIHRLPGDQRFIIAELRHGQLHPTTAHHPTRSASSRKRWDFGEFG